MMDNVYFVVQHKPLAVACTVLVVWMILLTVWKYAG